MRIRLQHYDKCVSEKLSFIETFEVTSLTLHMLSPGAGYSFLQIMWVTLCEQ